MKKVLLASLVGLGSVMGGTLANAQIIQYTPGSLAAADGALVGTQITLRLEGLEFPSNTIGGGVSLHFDDTILSLSSAADVVTSAAGNLFDFAFFNGSCGAGCVDFDFGTANPLRVFGPDFVIADIVFDVIGAGSTPVDLAAGVQSAFWIDDQFNEINPTFGTASITTVDPQAAVPVPPAVWLLGSGLIGLVGVGRRRSNKV